MKTNEIVAGTLWVTSVLAASAACGARTSQQQGPAAVAIAAPGPGVVNQTFIAPSSYSGNNLVGSVRVFTTKKKLSIAWSFDEAGPRKFHTEEFDLDFWPTSAARISDSRLTAGDSILLAGKRPASGKTVIERWDVTLPGLPGEWPTWTMPDVARSVDTAHPAPAAASAPILHGPGSRAQAPLTARRARKLRCGMGASRTCRRRNVPKRPVPRRAALASGA